MHDIQLTTHFRLSEFLRSETASARGIDNTPSLEVVSNLQQLCIHVLEPLRAYFNTPIVVSSGYRSPALNKAVGGSATSQHMTGEAADLRIPSFEVGKKWFEYLKTLPHDQLIWERDSHTSNHYWIHVSCRIDLNKNRNQCIPLLNKHSA